MSGLEVRGGAGGVHARYDDLGLLGRLYADLGADLVAAAWVDRGEGADGDLLASAPLAPHTFAAAEAAIARATYGPRGLVIGAAAVEAQSLVIVAVVELYRGADAAGQAAMEALSWSLGAAVGTQLPEIALIGGVWWVLDTDAGDRLVAVVERHPRLVERLADGGGGLVDGLALDPATGPWVRLLGLEAFHADTGAAAHDLGPLLFGRYAGELDPDYGGPHFSHTPPHDLADLLAALREVAGPRVPDGVFTVQELTRPDGTLRWIVHLPGTDSFVDEHAIRNMGSNLALLAGEDTAYGEAVRLALREAGAEPGEPVLLVGHSQGGMQALALAADPDLGVTDVVTAGSPVATIAVPDGVRVLSLENAADLVPLLDGERNPDRPGHTTVVADIRTGDLGATDGHNHALSTYEEIARSADTSTDPGVRIALDRLREAGFLAAPGEEVGSRTTTLAARQGEQLRAAGIDR